MKTGLESARPTKRPKGPELPEDREEPKAKPSPSTQRRWERSLTVAFTSAEIPERLRRLALEWGLYAPDRKSPAVSYLVEYLLLPRLEAAEAGEIESPPRGWRAERRATGGA
jgi:hypothetical protein